MRGGRGSALVLVFALGGAAIAPFGWADAYDAAMVRAVAAREKAVDSNDPAAWQEALRLFEEADALKATKDSKYEVGNAAARLKEDDVAVEAYEGALALGLGGKAKEKAAAFVASAAAKMARVEVTGPDGAQVFVGERKRGTLPRGKPMVVFAGTIKLRLVAADGKTAERSITANAGETTKVDLTPKDPPPAASASASAEPTPHLGSTPVPVGDPGAFARSLGWSMLVGGGLTMIGGGVSVFISDNNLSDRRSSLATHCKLLGHDGDTCTETTDNLRVDAQSDVDAIATWRSIRTVGWVAVGVGFTVGAIGAVRLLTAPRAPSAIGWMPSVDVARERLFFSLARSF
jgi:hypothetical protein